MKLFGGRLILQNKSTIVLLLGETVFKFIIGKGVSRKLMFELEGNAQAQNDPFWSTMVVPTSEIPFGLAAPRCDLVQRGDARIDRCISERLECLKESPRCAADCVTDLSMLHYNEGQASEKGLESRVKQYLFNFSLPVSSAHGDFHHDNFMTFYNKLVMIDWGFYRKFSSFLFDVVHYYVRTICNETKKSWVDVAFGELPHSSSVQEIAHKFGLDTMQLIVSYSVNRASLEVQQKYPSPEMMGPEVKEKYDRLFGYIDQSIKL